VMRRPRRMMTMVTIKKENKDSEDDNSDDEDILTPEELLFGKENAHEAGVAFGKLLEIKETEGGIWYETVFL
jgi:hypothetical protein